VTKGYYEFEFQLPEALLSQMIERLDGAEPGLLVPENLALIPDAQGVYQLFHRGTLVYIGKTDAEAGLRARLERHCRNVQHRHGIEPADVEFKALRVYVFTAVDLETQLIAHYGRDASPWNGSGFGANDPGRERETSTAKPGHFNLVYPLDIDRPLAVDLEGCATVAEALFRVKAFVPYVFRFEVEGRRRRQAHPALVAAPLPALPAILTMRSFLTAIVAALPEGWQATLLAGRVILYPETRVYPQGDVIARSSRGPFGYFSQSLFSSSASKSATSCRGLEVPIISRL
jgi:Uri superfamily endonuclease